jgi:acyl carrier protein
MNTPDRTRERLYQAIGGVLGLAPTAIESETSPDTVSTWDSLNHLNLVMAVETEFGIALTPEQVFDIRNVGTLLTIVREHGVDADVDRS